MNIKNLSIAALISLGLIPRSLLRFLLPKYLGSLFRGFLLVIGTLVECCESGAGSVLAIRDSYQHNSPRGSLPIIIAPASAPGSPRLAAKGVGVVPTSPLLPARISDGSTPASPMIDRLLGNGRGSLRAAKKAVKKLALQVFEQDQPGRTSPEALDGECAYGHNSRRQALSFKSPVVPADGALTQAAQACDLEELNRILRLGAVDQQELNAAFLMMAQVNNDDSHFTLYFSLIGASADVNVRDSSGRSALDWAVVNECPLSQEVLRKFGAAE